MPYNPTNPSNVENPQQVFEWVQRELRAIAKEFAETTALELRQVGAEPIRPREGMIVSADGVNWDPGAGAGAYEFKGGAWVKL